jgi:dihydropteroate synthase
MTTCTTVGGGSAPLGTPRTGRCLIMGVLNVTPDSFSDGGRYFDLDDAVQQGLSMARDGADIIDVGGESTRPGAGRITEAEELHRVVPVVSALAAAGIRVTIDTMRSRVAAAAVAVGAIGVNDVSGGLADPHMGHFIARANVPYILSHWRAPSAVMANRAVYGDVVEDVARELSERLRAFERAGVDPERIIVDPGLGFAKTADHNWQLLNRLARLQLVGRPMLIGASRKSFLRSTISPTGESDCSIAHLDTATAVITAMASGAGVYCVRVHDVVSSVVAVMTSMAWLGGGVRRHDMPIESHR